MSRCLLHKSRLDDFKSWLDQNKIEHRPGRGDYQVMQVRSKNGWDVVYDRHSAKEHFTVTWPMEALVVRFIRETRRTAQGVSLRADPVPPS